MSGDVGLSMWSLVVGPKFFDTDVGHISYIRISCPTKLFDIECPTNVYMPYTLYLYTP